MLTLLRRWPSSARGEGPTASRRVRVVAAGVALIVVLVIVGALSARSSSRGATGVIRDAVRDAAPAIWDAPPTVVGYLPYWEQRAAIDDALRQRDLLTTAAPWWYSPTDDGGVVEQHRGHTDTSDAAIRMLRDAGLEVMPAIANHHEGEWDFEIVPHIVADPDLRADHVRNLVALVEDRDYDGIVIDYELLGAGDRDGFTAFVTDLGAELHARDRRLAVALHAQASDQGSGDHNLAQDYQAIGQAADEVHLMTYDQHYDESDPGPIAPLPWVSDVLDYAIERIPPDKLVLGIGLFGYDWGGDAVADGLQLGQVARRIARNDGEQGWDERAASPWFRYDGDGVSRIIWYEDPASVKAKLALVERYDLGGAFFWRLGGVPEGIWSVAVQTLPSES